MSSQLWQNILRLVNITLENNDDLHGVLFNLTNLKCLRESNKPYFRFRSLPQGWGCMTFKVGPVVILDEQYSGLPRAS